MDSEISIHSDKIKEAKRIMHTRHTAHKIGPAWLRSRNRRLFELLITRSCYPFAYILTWLTGTLINRIDGNGKIEAIFGGSEGMDKVRSKEHAEQLAGFWGLKL